LNIGIDLGTTFSLVGYLNPQGIPTLVPDLSKASEYRTPSVVSVREGRAYAGTLLEEMLLDEPGMPITRGFKQLMGSTTPAFQDELGRNWPAEAVSAVILKKLLRDVDGHCAETIDHCLITVPANFNDSQRKAARAAAQLAGLSKVTLLEEPIAAAAFYGYSERDAEQTLLVYDFGGGTFDATVLQISSGRLFVLATEGANQLGGRHLDQALVDLVAADFQRRHGSNPLQDPAAVETLRRFAESAKIALAQPGRAPMRKTLLLAGKVSELSLAADQIERLVIPFVEATLEVCRRCLEGAGLGWKQIDRILLVGGSSLLPQVGRSLSAASGQPAAAMICKQPHHAVAYGAALLADAPASAAGDGGMPHHAVAPYHLGLRVRDAATGGTKIEVLIKRNTPLPTRAVATFYTTRPEQNRLIFDVVQSKGEAELAASLGVFAFGPLRHPRKNYPVELSLAYDEEGLVKVTARDMLTGEALERDLAHEDDPDLARVAVGRALLQSVIVSA
jgi:molecular chaperone DnaK